MVKKPKNPGIRKKWKPEALDKAMEAVRKEKLTIRKAAAKFNVPKCESLMVVHAHFYGFFSFI